MENNNEDPRTQELALHSMYMRACTGGPPAGLFEYTKMLEFRHETCCTSFRMVENPQGRLNFVQKSFA
jgi:hypothetical protein